MLRQENTPRGQRMCHYSIWYDINQVFYFTWLNTVLFSWSASPHFSYSCKGISKLIDWISLTFIFRYKSKAGQKVNWYNISFFAKSLIQYIWNILLYNFKISVQFLDWHIQVTITKQLLENKKTITIGFFFFHMKLWLTVSLELKKIIAC